MRAFHIKDDGAAWHAGEYVLGKEHHLAVGVDDLAVFGDYAQAVAIAVKGQAYFCVGFAQGAFQVFEVFGFARVGVVVGEVAINRAK